MESGQRLRQRLATMIKDVAREDCRKWAETRSALGQIAAYGTIIGSNVKRARVLGSTVTRIQLMLRLPYV